MVTNKEFSSRIEYRNENGQLHREDGPAIEYSSGYKSWYLNGIRYTEDQYQHELAKIKLKRLIEL